MNAELSSLLNTITEKFTRRDYHLEEEFMELEEWLAESIHQGNYNLTSHIKKQLSLLSQNQEPVDNKSYFTAKMHTMVNIIGLTSIPNETANTLKTLTDIEQEIFNFIAVHKEATNSDLVRSFELKKNYVSNLLNRLLNKNLVAVCPIGKFRYYSLTPLGRKLHQQYQEEIDQAKQIQAENKKRKKKETKKMQQLLEKEYTEMLSKMIEKRLKQYYKEYKNNNLHSITLSDLTPNFLNNNEIHLYYNYLIGMRTSNSNRIQQMDGNNKYEITWFGGAPVDEEYELSKLPFYK